MSNGVERRSQIDTETVKALLLINGGGIAALLTVFSQILGKPGYEPLASEILVGVLILMFGLVCAVIHNQLRRQCSLHYDLHGMKPPKGRPLGVPLWGPTVCCFSVAFMWLSIASFVVAGSYVSVRGIDIIGNLRAQQSAIMQKNALQE